MKLSLSFTSKLASMLAALLVACGTSDDNNQQQPEQPPAGDQPPAASGRQLIEGKLLATSPVNLIADPGFALAGDQAGYGSFIAYYESGSDQFKLDTTIDSRSPAGFGGAVGLVHPAGATDTKSEPVVLLTSFLGGAGPFHAQIWLSKSDVKGNAVDLPTDGTAVKVTVADGNPDGGESFDLKAVDGATRTIGGRTWVLFKTDVTKALTSGGFFVIKTGSKGGFIHLAAPEVTSDQVAIGQPVMRASLIPAIGRAKTPVERAAITKYRALPPKLVPAAPKPRIGN